MIGVSLCFVWHSAKGTHKEIAPTTPTTPPPFTLIHSDGCQSHQFDINEWKKKKKIDNDGFWKCQTWKLDFSKECIHTNYSNICIIFILASIKPKTAINNEQLHGYLSASSCLSISAGKIRFRISVINNKVIVISVTCEWMKTGWLFIHR